VPLPIAVETVDAFGNRTEVTTTATVSSTLTAAAPVDVSLINGIGVGEFTWTEWAFVDTLAAEASGFEGLLDVPVAEDCGVDGPIAAIEFGGQPDAVGCADPLTETAVVTADLGGSLAGVAPIAGYAVAELGRAALTSDLSFLDLALVGIGGHAVRGLVVDEDGCGDEVSAPGWTGLDDGSPVGLVPMTTAAMEVNVFDSVVVDIGPVRDCSRDPAPSRSLELRTTAGALSGLTATGEGLVVALDAAARASVTLDTDGELSDGVVELHATSIQGDGAAGGLLALPIVGDNLAPVVVSQSPFGAVVDPVDEVVLTFSEPLLDKNVVPANFGVIGPTLVEVLAADLDVDGRTVTLTLDPPADPALGGYVVSVLDAVRDAAGNRLAGSWSGVPGPYLGGFGNPGGPADVTCTSFTPTGLVLRPDGDPGVEAESDELLIGVEALTAPAWWVVEVRAADDALVWQDWEVPAGSVDVVAWDGRGLTGAVLENGPWRVLVRPDDGLGNQGTGCEVTVTIDNPLGSPP
jgi:hypothetical protein